MAWRLADDEDPHGVSTSVESLVLLAGEISKSVARVKDEVLLFGFEGEFSFENVEELAGVDVRVTDLAGHPGEQELFDDADPRGFDEVPAVGVGAVWTSPLVVLGGFCVDDGHG